MRRLLLLIVFCCMAATTVVAQELRVDSRIELAQSGCKSLSDAVEQIRRQTNGRIVGAETRVKNGREVHQIKVLTKDGKVKTHKVQGCKRSNG